MTVWFEPTSRTREDQVLASAQVAVAFATNPVTVDTEFHVYGLDDDGEILTNTVDYNITNATTINLTESRPAGTVVASFV